MLSGNREVRHFLLCELVFTFHIKYYLFHMVNADIKQTLERNEERISRLMVRRIGTVFDNESLLEMEREEKVLSSIRLSLAGEDRDLVNPDVEILDEKGLRV